MKGRIRIVRLNRALTGAFITLLFAFSMSVRAAVPEIMNFQGKLTDSGGTAVTSTVPMTFKLYTSASGGAAVWTEVQSVTPDINGLYSVHLGEVTQFNIVFSTAYWLGVTVGSDGEMSPRYRLVSSPYALQASSSSWAEGVSWSGVADKPSLNIFLSTSAFTAQHASLPGVKISSGLIISNGNVGISTGAPQGRLDVLAAGSSATDMVQIWRRSDGVIVGSMSASGIMTAVKFLGDGSGLSGIVASSGDSLGTHVATTTLQMGLYGVNTSSDITAARYQIAGRAVLAALPGEGSLSVGMGAGRVNAGDFNVFVGSNAGYSNTIGTVNSFIGYQAGYANTQGFGNSFMGASSGYSNTIGNDNIFLGYAAGYSNTTGSHNSFVGHGAGYSNTTGSDNSFVGREAGYSNTTGSDNILVGFRAGDNITTGTGNIVIGYGNATSAPEANFELNIGGLIFGDLSSGRVGISTASPGATLHVNGQLKISDGSQGAGKVLTSDASGNATWQGASGGGDSLGSHVATTTLQMGAYGVNTSSNITAARYQIAGSTVLAVLPGVASLGVGIDAGRMNTGPYNSFLGYRAGYSNTTGWDNTFLGYSAGSYNTTGWDNTFLGRGAGYNNTTGDSNSFLGADAGFANTTGSSNSFLGADAGYSNTTGNFNSIIGFRAGYSNTTGSSNSFLGYGAGLSNTTGNSNSFLGFNTGSANTMGGNNSFLGYGAGYSNTTGNSNTFIGSSAGYYTRTGSANAIFGNAAGYGVLTNSFSSSTIMGYQAGYGLTTGSDNILLGFRAGYGITTGTGNIVIGYLQDTSAAAASNELNIGGLIYGDLSAGKVGIGTASPGAKLHVNGPLKLSDGSQGAGKVLTSDAAGNATWQTSAIGDVFLASTQTFTGQNTFSDMVTVNSNITTARYQIAGSTVLAVLPGIYSLGVGVDAGRVNTGNFNSFLGYTAGYFNTTGAANSFFGNMAGYSNTTANYNSFIGYMAGYSNTTGTNNSFLGAEAGYLNTTGTDNSFFGYEAGYSNTTGAGNTFIGYNSGGLNSIGNSNAFLGLLAGYKNTTGSNNSFLGFNAGYTNTIGSNNSFLGYRSGYYNTTGENNSFLGYMAGFRTETGSANVIFGNEAGNGVTNNSFSSSTIMGYQAGYGLTTGSDNILVGFKAGDSITAGTGNIVIGYAQDTSAPTANNELNIGGLIYGDLSAGKVGIGTVGPQSSLHVADGKYAQFEDNNAGAPPVADCDSDQERGRLSIDTANNRLYICNGAARGWDYLALTD